VFDSLFPAFGSQGNNLPVWDEGQKMFLGVQYTSEAGHLYYKGLRFSDRIAVVETVSKWNTWTYINEIQVYRFEGNSKVLIGTRKFDKVFYDSQSIKSETEQIVRDYMKGMLKLSNNPNLPANIDSQAKQIVGDTYKSFLDSDYILPCDMVKMLSA
jgi:hypothetical protein